MGLLQRMRLDLNKDACTRTESSSMQHLLHPAWRFFQTEAPFSCCYTSVRRSALAYEYIYTYIHMLRLIIYVYICNIMRRDKALTADKCASVNLNISLYAYVYTANVYIVCI